MQNDFGKQVIKELKRKAKNYAKDPEKKHKEIEEFKKTLQKKSYKKTSWKTIGHVAVDSGTLMLIDPCYAIDFTNDDYSKYVIATAHEKTVQVPFDKGHFGRAVIFSSGLGDGVYTVKAKFEHLGIWGERITEVRVIMK